MPPEASSVFTPFVVDHLVRDLARLALAAVVGAILGAQRERVHSSAGLRTHIMVSLGSALSVLCGIGAGFAHDAMSRVIQGVVVGIGFLGAGTILKFDSKNEVHGLTTAASIWMTAAVGVAAGLGHLGLAAAATLVGWLVLGPLHALEKRRPGECPPQD